MRGFRSTLPRDKPELAGHFVDEGIFNGGQGARAAQVYHLWDFTALEEARPASTQAVRKIA